MTSSRKLIWLILCTFYVDSTSTYLDSAWARRDQANPGGAEVHSEDRKRL